MKLIKDGHVIDPANSLDDIMDILIVNDKISKIEKNIDANVECEIINAKGLKVFPGLIDMHVHLREPGFEHKETIQTGLAAAAKGGFTTVACMPNTKPAIDDRTIVEALDRKARGAKVNLKVIGAATKNIDSDQLTEMGDMKEAGIVAISNDGKPVKNAYITRRVLEYAKKFDLILIEHCEDESMANGGFIHEGYYSTILGLKGIPRESEDLIVARDIALAKMTGGKVHIAHMSSKNSVQLVREAKIKGINVTAEVTSQHLVLTDQVVESFDTSTKINPPFRSEDDREALLAGIIDGTIDLIVTDHAPHARWEKEVEYAYAPFGVVGLETSLSLMYTKFVKTGIISYNTLVEKMANNPGRIFKLGGELKIGADADITIFDPNKEWVVNPDVFYSMGRNTPFKGWNLEGEVVHTIVKGDFALKDGKVI
ncbi:MAG: dihydroorotase [Firmicutes bacterium]|nr:dihydroorotase [Bacillota bacterium]